MKNSIKEKNSRLEWVNYAKGIAIILVVYRHILIGIERSGIDVQLWLKNANEIVYSFRMPLFFVLSGIFVAKSIAKRQGNEFVKTKLSTIFYPYIVWGVIQISIQIILSKYTNANRDLMDFVYLLIHPRAIDQLWYLYALFNSSILFYLLYSKLKLNNIILIVISVILYGLSVFVKEYSLIHDIFYYFVFFVLGHLASDVLLNRENYGFFYSFKPFLILTPFFWWSQWYWLNNQEINLFLFGLIAVLGTFYVFTVSFLLAKYNSAQFLKTVGRHSLHIYLMHLLIVSAVRIFFTNFLNIHEPTVILIFGWGLGVFLPIVLYKLFMRINFGFLFEYKYKSKD